MQTKTVGVKVPVDMYHELRALAESENISFSAFLRNLLTQRLTESQPNTHESLTNFQLALTALEKQLTDKGVELNRLSEQLSTKDGQISQLHQLVAIAQQNAGELTRQLEDHRVRKWWRFWK